MTYIIRPSFQLRGTTFPYTDSYKYLSHIISSELSDDDPDIMTQIVARTAVV